MHGENAVSGGLEGVGWGEGRRDRLIPTVVV